MKRVPIAISALLLAATSACTTAVQKLVEVPKCNFDASLLAPCSDPVPVSEGSTFSQIIDFWVNDREALTKCSNQQKTLAGTAAECKSQVDALNARNQKLNAESK